MPKNAMLPRLPAAKNLAGSGTWRNHMSEQTVESAS